MWVLGLAVLGVALVGGGALWIDQYMPRKMRPYIYSSAEKIPAREVALVLGARVYSDGRLSPMLYDRVATAVDLYKAGKVKKLLMSGDNSERHYDEVSAMRRVAIRMGVPSDDVVRDFAGFRTYDSFYRARDVWKLRSLSVVTQQFHLPRSLYTARGLGLDAVGLIADRRAYSARSYSRSRVREVASRTVAFFEVNVLRRKPHFLGPPQDLSGDRQEAVEQKKDWRKAPNTPSQKK